MRITKCSCETCIHRQMCKYREKMAEFTGKLSTEMAPTDISDEWSPDLTVTCKLYRTDTPGIRVST